MSTPAPDAHRARLDALTAELVVGCDTFADLIALAAYPHRYRPTLRPDLDPRYGELADAYDAHFAALGLVTRAFRDGPIGAQVAA